MEEENKEVNNTTKTKGKKLPIIITVSVLVLIIALGIGGYFIYQNTHNNDEESKSKTVGTEWGDTYYAYLKEATDEKNDKENYGLQDDMENIKLQFIDVEEENPIMVMIYEKEDNEYVNIYRTTEKGKVDKIIYSQPSTVEFLYDIKNKAYSWYLHTQTIEEDVYKLLAEILKNPNDNIEADYAITKGEKTTQETLSGEEITLLKFDETFVKPEIENSKKIDFSIGMKAKDLKDNIKNGIEEYKKQSDLVTENVKTKTEEKVTELETTKQAIETAKKEIEKEELARGLKVGGVTLKYGKYVSDVSKMDSSMYGTIILKPNGKFHVKANCEGDYPYPKLDCDGTYKVTRILNSFEYFDGLEFTTDTGVKFALEAHQNGQSGKLSDQWHGYSYVGEE